MCLPGTVEQVREQQSGVTRRSVLAGGGAAALAALAPDVAGAQRRRGRGRKKLVDLTHTFVAGFPVYTDPQVTKRTLVTIPANGFYSQEWTFGEQAARTWTRPATSSRAAASPTSCSRASSCCRSWWSTSPRARRDPDTVVTPDDLRRWERRHGRIPRGALVAMDSGWDRKVGDPDEFKGVDSSGGFHFPGFSEDAIDALIEDHGRAIGVDTLSLDPGTAAVFVVHTKWLGTDRYGIEGLRNLSKLPARRDRHGRRDPVARGIGRPRPGAGHLLTRQSTCSCSQSSSSPSCHSVAAVEVRAVLVRVGEHRFDRVGRKSPRSRAAAGERVARPCSSTGPSRWGARARGSSPSGGRSPRRAPCRARRA